ncbi:MAG: orotate phosphoribosyltransferase [Candidatus Caenarcaniphilales bacterium]|nr:orotate phosphoribosyltransferase [Candidatus Caenarcaniphilales bacterium]
MSDNPQNHAKKERLLGLLRDQAVLKGDFTLASGAKSSFYLDTRLVTLSSEGINLISELIFERIKPLLGELQGVAGPTMGADPLVTGVSMYSFVMGSPLKAGYVRKAVKDHGCGRQVEGPIKPGEHVLVLEDVITSGRSSLQAIDALRKAGMVVNHLLCLVLREDSGKDFLEEEAKLKVDYLFRAVELLD